MRSYVRNLVLPGLLFSVLLTAFGCAQPVLEPESCLGARDPVKRLYSLHMDSGPNPLNADLEKMRGFLSANLYRELGTKRGNSEDYLTQSREFPKAFRVGTCRDAGNGPEFDVLLFWRTEDFQKEQKIIVTAANENKWVVSSVRK
ncbi:MAG: hypothetical protein OEM82_10165 [Acidobacteriota bacterium]|nr:hypothetical protein [Acidobacteriota bacterium]MDH3528695.1 hypothetical protein [Acidobacteriota bacterium]